MDADHIEITCDAKDCTWHALGGCGAYKIHIRTTRGFHTCTNYKRRTKAMKVVRKRNNQTTVITPDQFNTEAGDVLRRILNCYGR